MFKKIFISTIIFMMVIGLVVNVYAQKASGVTELKFTSTVPDVSGLGRGQKAWIEKCERDSGGKLKIIPYWSNSLFKPREIFRGALDGQADLCYWVTSVTLLRFHDNIEAHL